MLKSFTYRARRALLTALCAVLFLNLSSAIVLPCTAQEPSAGNPVQLRAESGDSLCNQILKKEIELFRLTALFRLNNPRETKLHRWYIAATSTLAYATANAGNITTFTNAYNYHTHPQDFSKGRSETGPFLIFLGEIFFVSRTVGGAAIDLLEGMHARRHGFDRKTFESKAEQLQSQIQQLLAQRQASLTASGASSIEMLEQAVLQDLSNCASAEFISNYARATRLKAFRITDNIMHNYTSGTGAFWGGLVEYLASTHSKPRMAGPAGIGFIVSGSGFILGDTVPYWTGKWVQKRTRARLLEKNPHATVDSAQQLERDRQTLASAAGATVNPGNLALRLKAYESLQRTIVQHHAMSNQEEKEMWHRYLHDQIINAIEGGANIAAGTVLADAGYDFQTFRNPFKALRNADRFLTKFGTSALIFTPTASAGILDTPGEALYGSWKNRLDSQRGLSAGAVMNGRLDELDRIDKTL